MDIKKPLLKLGMYAKFNVKGEPVHIRVMDFRWNPNKNDFKYYLGETVTEGAFFYEEQLKPFIEN